MYFIEFKIQDKDGKKIKFSNPDHINKIKFRKYFNDNIDYCKFDFVLYLKGSFIELSVIYVFNKDDLDYNKLKISLSNDFMDLVKEKKYYKALKRVFAILKLEEPVNRQALIEISQLFNSATGELYKENSVLKAIKLLIESGKATGEVQRRIGKVFRDMKFTNLDQLDRIIASYDKLINEEGYKFLKHYHPYLLKNYKADIIKLRGQGHTQVYASAILHHKLIENLHKKKGRKTGGSEAPEWLRAIAGLPPSNKQALEDLQNTDIEPDYIPQDFSPKIASNPYAMDSYNQLLEEMNDSKLSSGLSGTMMRGKGKKKGKGIDPLELIGNTRKIVPVIGSLIEGDQSLTQDQIQAEVNRQRGEKTNKANIQALLDRANAPSVSFSTMTPQQQKQSMALSDFSNQKMLNLQAQQKVKTDAIQQQELANMKATQMAQQNSIAKVAQENASNQASSDTANQNAIATYQQKYDAYYKANPNASPMDWIKYVNSPAFNSNTGGSKKQAGYIKRLIAEKKFDINKIKKPSKWLVEKYKKQVIMKVKPNIQLKIREKKKVEPKIEPAPKSKKELKKEYDRKRYLEKKGKNNL